MSTIVAAAPRVPSSSWPVPEERRTVSVLFVDIVGSTALVDRLDPEDVRAVQRAYFDTVAGVLRRWQGVVEKYIGDAVMALFGARTSDGFDAYRAVRAGLEIQRELDRRALPGGVAIRVRVGVATGEAVVDLAAARDGGHGAASGAVITTAARLQEYAPPGGVVCCAATHRATAGLMAQRRLTPVTVPGRAPAMEVWHALAPAAPRPGRHDGPLVGRRREVATARDRIVQAVRERSPRWVSVVGPSGSGRSRLLDELTRTVDAVDGVPVRWCVAACPPYPDEPLAPLARLLSGVAGAGAREPAPVVGERLAATLAGLLPPSRLATALPALERLLAAPDDTPSTAEGVAWCQEVLLRLAARGPLVVAVDDLDRAAPAVDRFLHALFVAAAARELPLAVVALHHPDRAAALPAAPGSGTPAESGCRVTLGPLAPVQTGRLLRQLLTRAGQPASLVTRLLPLVGGNPGHATAYVHSLAHGTNRAAPPLPESVGRVVGADLDRLDGTRRAVLMAGAVLPPGFTADEVERVLDWSPGRVPPALSALVAAGLLLRHAGGGYALASPALRRVAADRLPRRFRAAFTQRAADVVLSQRLRRADLRRGPAGPAGGPATPAGEVPAGPAPHRPATRRQAPPVHPAGAAAPRPVPVSAASRIEPAAAEFRGGPVPATPGGGSVADGSPRISPVLAESRVAPPTVASPAVESDGPEVRRAGRAPLGVVRGARTEAVPPWARPVRPEPVPDVRPRPVPGLEADELPGPVVLAGTIGIAPGSAPAGPRQAQRVPPPWAELSAA
ncbi:adenylate/guanylate cyclase domain-containing protein [Micromonospora costi]|uniref:adenylate/guanylate cyclase domain-containing protein n=1 Tax=Micromonospora costi TaxID=1530042 RepID=UPI0019D4D6D3|nr:adenylate/guanylate cyclase domain-containing protein [Micromonospora costi]